MYPSMYLQVHVYITIPPLLTRQWKAQKPLSGRNPEAPQTASGKLLHFRGKGLSARNGGHFAARVACIGEFSKIRGTLFGVLITRILLFRVLY